MHLALAAVLALAAPAASKRPITETDLFRFVWVADPRVSPDGTQVAFVRVTVDDKKEGYDTAIWMVPADGSQPARAFTSGPRDSAPRWSPDGKTIAFLRAVLKDGKREPPQIHLIGARGGEGRAISDVPRGAGPPAWSPDGKSIAFTCPASARDLEKARRQKAGGKERPDQEDERESDVRVVTRSVYRSDGSGYVDDTRPDHVWILDVPAGPGVADARPLTSGEFDEGELSWSPDGTRLFFATDRVKDASYAPPDRDLYSVAREGGEARLEASIDGPIRDYALSPDGKRVAFAGFENPKQPRSFDQVDLFVADVPAGAAKNLTTGFDNDVDGAIIGDQRAPRGGLSTPIVWTRGQRFAVVKAAQRGRGNLKTIDLGTGSVSALTAADQDILGYSASADASQIAMVVSTPTVLGDLVMFDTRTRLTRPLYRPNRELFSELSLTEPEELLYTSFDGQKIQAWIQKPPDYKPGRKYPVILNIHGGPHAAYGYLFMHEFQWMAAKGYVVLYPNPRGSSSYGQDFGNVIQYRYPGDDYEDLMAGVDELVRRGIADPERLGVTGGSGGGVLTNWTITRTDRFKAAVSQRSISDWASWWYTADFTQFQPEWFRGAPFEVPREFAERSAITQVGRVKTPLMLIEGEADYRTPPTAGGEPMFRALRYRRIPTVMVRFPGEGHNLSRSGGPWHRVERLRHIVAWFDLYLLGRPSIEYDLDSGGSRQE